MVIASPETQEMSGEGIIISILEVRKLRLCKFPKDKDKDRTGLRLV